MMTKTKASQLCRFVYVYVLPSAILLSAGAPAQQVPTEADDSDEETIEEILVTGSRLRQDPLEARNPIQVLTYEDFERSGDVNFAEYLQRLPANGSAINRTNNSSGNLVPAADGSGYGAGSVQIDLRYLQAKRTLVLVDGRRWVRNSSASGVGGSIDLNTIPQNAIESIEVLLDGASTIYGSDAIGGVVNIITKATMTEFRPRRTTGNTVREMVRVPTSNSLLDQTRTEVGYLQPLLSPIRRGFWLRIGDFPISAPWIRIGT